MGKALLNGYSKQSSLQLNKYIKNQFISFDKNNLVSNLVIKTAFDYSITREERSRSYIMTFPNLIIIAISKKKTSSIEDFELLYANSTEYIFHVYETQRYYHLICLSRYKSDITLEPWLYANDADPKYINLYDIYGPFLIMNKSWFVSVSEYPYQTKYTFVKSIGEGSINDKIADLVKQTIGLINNEYMNFLPNHYLCYP